MFTYSARIHRLRLLLVASCLAVFLAGALPLYALGAFRESDPLKTTALLVIGLSPYALISMMPKRSGLRDYAVVALVDSLFFVSTFEGLAYTVFPGWAKDWNFFQPEHLFSMVVVVTLNFSNCMAAGLVWGFIKRGRGLGGERVGFGESQIVRHASSLSPAGEG